MRKVLWLVLLALVLVVGCTEEQDVQVERLAGPIGGGARTAAPFLPPPFNLIALAVAGVAQGISAKVAYNRKKRAVTAEEREFQEREMKNKLDVGIQVFGDMIDTLREGENKPEVEKFLKLIDSYKRSADANVTRAFGWYDTARKRIG